MAQKPNALFTRGANAPRPELAHDMLVGAFRAFVEVNTDPEMRGRIQVRLWQQHGPPEDDEEKRIATGDLPWALPAFSLVGGKDFGSFTPPPVGSMVWVMSAGGETDELVYFGGYFLVRNKEREYLRSMDLPEHEISMAGTDDKWTAKPGPEAPAEALEMLHASPEIWVLGKSVKGHALVFNDQDEREHLALVDRVGQGLHFEGELKKSPNLQNAYQRGARTVYRGKRLVHHPSDPVANETRVQLLDSAGQVIDMLAHKGAEKIRILSRPIEDDNVHPHQKELKRLNWTGGMKATLVLKSAISRKNFNSNTPVLLIYGIRVLN